LKNFHVQKSFGQKRYLCTQFLLKLAVSNLLVCKNPHEDWTQHTTEQYSTCSWQTVSPFFGVMEGLLYASAIINITTFSGRAGH